MCRVYKDIVDYDAWVEAQKCRDAADYAFQAACSCYFSAAFSDCLASYPCSVGSQRNCTCQCEVQRSAFCNAYKTCGTYPFESQVICPLSPPSFTTYTLSAPCFKDEKEAVALKIISELNRVNQFMNTRKGWMEPTNCTTDLGQEAYIKNNSDPEILAGCKAKYIIQSTTARDVEYVNASKGCVKCGPTPISQNIDIYFIAPDPNFKVPPSCTTPGPPTNDCGGAGG